MKNSKNFAAWLVTLFAVLFFFGRSSVVPAQKPSNPPLSKLSENSRALLPVVVSHQSGEATRNAAADLAEYLSRITGGEFKVQTGDGKSGIVLGTVADFPALALQKTFDANDAEQQEDYILRSHANGVHLIAATEKGVSHAVWDFLSRLGYRQFFPGDHWEIVPSTPSLSIAVDVREHPDYYTRRIWFTYGTWKDNKERVAQWEKKNRMGGMVMNFGHAYGGIIRRNQAEFDKHPEYFTELNGKRMVRAEGKFDISNPGLRQLVIDDALKYFEEHPEYNSYSVDPSDGGNWGNSAAEEKLGSISDRVVFLANEVAEAVSKKYPDKYIAFYAYNFHSPPPSIRLHPNTAVSVATAFIKGGYTAAELIAGWQKMGAKIGIREYYSIPKWDRDMPRQARASSINFITSSIPRTYKQGARFMSAESGDNWGPHGLGYYIASRLLWNVDEAGRADELVDDFMTKSFGPASEEMQKFYGLITDGLPFSAPKQPVEEPLVAAMYRALDAALKKTDDPKILARIGDLVTYTRFIELYRAFRDAAPGNARLAAFETLMRHSYRTHPQHMTHTLAQYRTRFSDRTFKVPAEANWQQPDATNPWKSNEPFSLTEIRTMVKEGIANNQPLPFEMAQFSRDLVPATPLKLQSEARGAINMSKSRGWQSFLVWVPEGAGGVDVEVMALKDQNAATVRLVRVLADEPEIEENAEEEEENEDAPEIPTPEILDSAEIPPEHKYFPVRLKSPHSGLHRVQISNGLLEWPEKTQVTVESSLAAPRQLHKRGAMYFYVPKGTRVLGVYSYGAGQVRSASGKIVFDLRDGGKGYSSIPVAPGEDGKLWKFERAAGELRLITVPPYMARSAGELLLPREVVEADVAK